MRTLFTKLQSMRAGPTTSGHRFSSLLSMWTRNLGVPRKDGGVLLPGTFVQDSRRYREAPTRHPSEWWKWSPKRVTFTGTWRQRRCWKGGWLREQASLHIPQQIQASFLPIKNVSQFCVCGILIIHRKCNAETSKWCWVFWGAKNSNLMKLGYLKKLH